MFPLYKTPQVKLDIDAVSWYESPGQKLISRVILSGGVSATTAPEHVGKNPGDCPWCRNKKLLDLSAWGDKHVFSPNDVQWRAYQNGNLVGEFCDLTTTAQQNCYMA